MAALGEFLEDFVFIEGVAFAPVVGAEEVVDGVEGKGVGIAAEDEGGFFRRLAKVGRERGICRFEDEETALGEPGFAIAAPRGLSERINAGDSAVDHGEINIHTCFDEGGADHATRGAARKAFADMCENVFAMSGAEEGAEVDCIRKEASEGAGVRASIDDAKDLWMLGKMLGKLVVVEGTEVGGVDAFELFVQGVGVGDDFSDVIEAIGKFR